MLHEEYDCTVSEILPWGVLFKTVDGVEILVDNVKKSSLRLNVGDRSLVVVLDDKRIPYRGSCLEMDLRIGRHLRGEDSWHR